MKDNRFYYDGIFYENEEQFYRAVKNFSESDISRESVERILAHMCKEISENLFMMKTDRQISNDQLKNICSYILIRFVNQYRLALESK